MGEPKFGDLWSFSLHRKGTIWVFRCPKSDYVLFRIGLSWCARDQLCRMQIMIKWWAEFALNQSNLAQSTSTTRLKCLFARLLPVLLLWMLSDSLYTSRYISLMVPPSMMQPRVITTPIICGCVRLANPSAYILIKQMGRVHERFEFQGIKIIDWNKQGGI